MMRGMGVHPDSRRAGRPWARLVAMLALSLAIGLAHGGAEAAEPETMQVVGAIPIDAELRRKSILKDLAIQEALWQGVSRVANDLLEEQSLDVLQLDGVDGVDGEADAGTEEPADGTAAGDAAVDPVRTALGQDMVAYTKSFRILEDQGERPVMFTQNPDAATEYVVIVEVHVDAERVAAQLRTAGLLVERGADVLTRIRLEVRGLMQYAGLATLVALIEGDAVGAESVAPTEFQRGVTLMQVRAEWGADELLERLLAAAPPELVITPVSVTEKAAQSGIFGEMVQARSELVLTVSWTPPPAEEPPEGEQPTARWRR